MADNASYPTVPHRPNFTDIRTMQIFDPVLTKTTATNAVGNSAFVQVHAAGATLENGVRIKCIDSDNLRVGIYDSNTHTGTTGDNTTGGFDLDEREEVFIEVRQLSHVWVRAASGSSGYSIIAS